MSFSIYDLDEHILELLNLDNFLGGLSVNDFVEELSKDHILKGAEVNKLEYLDPKPYIRTFESTLRELKRLEDKALARSKEAENEVDDYELKYGKDVLQLSQNVENITQEFQDLDLEISEVFGKVDTLGQSLNQITSSRDRALETIFLIRSYHGFYTKEKYDPLESLRLSDKYEDIEKCANTVKDLLILAKKISSPDLPKTEHCVFVIEKYSETMERHLLEKFDSLYESDEYAKMREISTILINFNGGGNVVQLFLNKHDFMLDAEIIDDGAILDNETMWSQLSDPKFGEIIKDESTETLLDKLKLSITGQARIVQQVFSDPTPVLKIFIQRIYAQIIQNKVSTLLQYSLSVSILAHVRILYALFVLIGDFTKYIKEFLMANDLDKYSDLNSILDQSYYDLFIQYISENSYFTKERKNLEEMSYHVAQRFNVHHEKALSNKYLTTKLENLDNAEYEDKNTQFSQDKLTFHFLEKKRLGKFANFMKNHLTEKNKNSAELERSESSTEKDIRIENVETVIKSFIEAIARILELAPSRAPEYILDVLEVLIFDFGKLYVSAGIEVAYDCLKQESSSSRVSSTTPLDLNHLTIFKLTSSILYIMSSCVKKIMLPCVVNFPNIRNRMSGLTNSYVGRCEVSLNIIINDTIQLICSRVTYLLNKQKKADFTSDTLVEEDTEACELVSNFLTHTFEDLKMHLNDTNLNNVLIKIGLNVLNQLLEHYKKFPVSSTGAITLTKDIIRFQTVIDEWGIPELSENFQILREVGNLFSVHPNLISSLVTEGRLTSLKPYMIRQYISKRSDFNPTYIERLLKFNFKK